MDNSKRIEHFNARAPGFFQMLGGKVVALDAQQQTCTIEFNISLEFCHSVDVVQGGFITAMLDAAMSHSVFAAADDITGVSSLEIKTSYPAPTRAGILRAEGRIVKSGYKIAFLEGELYDQQGELTATASSVAKLVRAG